MPNFENLESYVEAVWKTQGALADALGVSKQTVSQWAKKSRRVSLDFQNALRALKPPYDGPFPDVSTEITREELREDLEALRHDLRAMIGWAREESQKENRALAATLEEVLKRTVRQKENPPHQP